MADVVVVNVVSVQGSAPRDIGARMVVDKDTTTGSIGGGRLEFEATKRARRLLEKDDAFESLSVKLGPEIGQCCGGNVGLEFRKVSQDDDVDLGAKIEKPNILIFGGGHVGVALARAFSLLPVSTQVVETRSEYLNHLPKGVEPLELAAPEAAIEIAPPRSVFIVVTHDHSLDFLIVEDALKRGDASYVGMIGSNTKRAVLEARLKKADINPAHLVCPIGKAGLGNKSPEVIAAFVVAEVLLGITLDG